MTGTGTGTGPFDELPEDHRERLTALSREVSWPAGTRIFEEGGRADRFWTVLAGTVRLDLYVPGSRPVVVETIGPGQLLGWSWVCPPRRWHLGAEAGGAVRAREYDAAEVLERCARDPALDHALLTYVIGVVGHRLRSTRTRLLDLYGPHGGEGPR
ncbi:Crp/Fnr family transcriptional regulator [Streptomyces laurentii]|uniref:Crp/Fnr family transcriptional regulator n=1 Tax=Streptomyces laurentii TaxID=39478 RepID=UPI003685CB14